MTAREFTDEAIVLKRMNINEADKILVMFTKDHGKLGTLAKGIRRLTSKKAGHLEPFTHVKVALLKGYQLPLITQVESLHPFFTLKNDYELTKLAFTVCEVTDRLLADDEVYPDIFGRLVQSLFRLDSSQTIFEAEAEVLSFQVFLLKTLGFGLPDEVNELSVQNHIENLIDRKLNSTRKL
jgi:DNA repair protein RecO (recombination protein O)